MNMSMKYWGCILLCLVLNLHDVIETEAARILGVFPIPSVSHQIVYRAVMKGLALHGHEVVVITTDPMRDSSIKNYTEFDVSFTFKMFNEKFNFASSRDHKVSNEKIFELFLDFGNDLCEGILSHPPVNNLISLNNTEEHFDIVFLEWLLTPCVYAFAHRFSAPMIGIASLPAFGVGHDSVGNPNLPAYSPEAFLPYSDHMSFLERVHSVWFLLWQKYHFYYTVIPNQDAIARRHFGDSLPYLGDLHTQPSMLFLTTNYIFHNPRPYVPAVVLLDRLHMNEPKPLPKDIQMFIDNAPKGVIYFSLGSNVKSDTMTQEKRQIFLDAFAELPDYHVLWKWESDRLPGQTSNVKVAKWFPQQDILRNPKVKANIMQGGLQSIEEALLVGVPLIAIPFFSDQDFNAKKVEEKGIGIKLDFAEITKEELLFSLGKVINDSRYRENVIHLAKLLNDQPQTAMDRAIWWTDYVLRHKGAKHLRTAAVDMPWYQFLLLDVIAFIFLISITMLTIMFISVRAVYKAIQRHTPKKHKLQ
uniref:UDP-glucuronosyltransferase n=2 Tax=Timema poppense TaxID=170557 RepID=A0A7R9D9Q5_TIMPO|nr:unnamed protein product [Timema poppensis]